MRRLPAGADAALPGFLSATLPGIHGETLVLDLARRGLHLSSGSACKSGHPEPSPALLAVGLTPEQAHCMERFSLGAGDAEEDVDEALRPIRAALADAREALRFVACR